jgi:hypothetical protein
MTKRCAGCHSHKGPTAFHKDRSRRDGLKQYCRACSNARRAGYRAIPRPKPPPLCASCKARRHGRPCGGDMVGCACGCRRLGLHLFEGGDPTAPSAEDPAVA